MAGSKSDFLEGAYLNAFFRGSATPIQGTVFVGLWKAALDDASTGSAADEVSGTGYNRATVVCNSTNWSLASGGTVSNAAAISFGTAGADWGTVTHLAVLSANSAGNIFYWADLTASKIIQNGDPVQINVGDLVISES